MLWVFLIYLIASWKRLKLLLKHRQEKVKALKAQLTGGIWDREMNSFEFSDKLSHFPEIKKHFEGIFSADNLPKKI